MSVALAVLLSCGLLQGIGAADTPMAWTVTFVDSGCETRCGGTLIAPGWVLTAAHCICHANVGAGDTAAIGDDCATKYTIAKVFVHPDFGGNPAAPNDSDIALVRLNECPGGALPAIGATDAESDTPVTAAGRGDDGSGEQSTSLEMMQLTLETPDDCETVFQSKFTGNMLCAEPVGGDQGICGGDSGGPALVRREGEWMLVGVAAFGGCREQDSGKHYSVFTRLMPFMEWLQETMASVPPCPSE